MRHRALALTAAVMLFGGGSLLAGCGGSSSDQAPADSNAEHAAAGDHAASDHAGNAPEAGQQPPAAHVIPAGTEVTLTGTVGCGHCTYQIGNSCSTAMKTSDGIVWILDGIGPGNELFENRFDAGEITMAGVVSYVDGVAHLTPSEGASGTEM